MREGGGNCLKYLKRGCDITEGKGHKDFKKGGQAGSRGGCLKKGGGLEPPYELCSCESSQRFQRRIQNSVQYSERIQNIKDGDFTKIMND